MLHSSLMHLFTYFWTITSSQEICLKNDSNSGFSLGPKSNFHGMQWLWGWMLQLCWAHWGWCEHSLLLCWPPQWDQDQFKCRHCSTPQGSTLRKEQGFCPQLVWVKFWIYCINSVTVTTTHTPNWIDFFFENLPKIQTATKNGINGIQLFYLGLLDLMYFFHCETIDYFEAIYYYIYWT